MSVLELWRQQQGLTQKQVAELAGLSIATVDRAESGECGRRSARALSKLTGIPAGQIMDLDKVTTPSGEASPEATLQGGEGTHE